MPLYYLIFLPWIAQVLGHFRTMITVSSSLHIFISSVQYLKFAKRFTQIDQTPKISWNHYYLHKNMLEHVQKFSTIFSAPLSEKRSWRNYSKNKPYLVNAAALKFMNLKFVINSQKFREIEVVFFQFFYSSYCRRQRTCRIHTWSAQ